MMRPSGQQRRDPPGIKEPISTTSSSATTAPPRAAGEKTHATARGDASSSPSDSSSSPRRGQQLGSTGPSSRRRFASLSINDAINSGSTSAHGCGESEKAGAGLSTVETPGKHRAVAASNNGVMPRKHRAVAGSSGEALQKNQAVTGSNGQTQQENLKDKKKSGGGLSGQMPQKNYRKKRAAHSEELSADERRRIEEEMVKNVQEADRAIQQLNELGLGEDISYQEFEAYLEQLPCEPPCVDTSIDPDDDQLCELQLRNILYRIKYCKFTRQRRKDGEIYTVELEDDHPLYHLEEKLECLEEDVTKLDLDHLLNYLEKEGLVRQIQNDDIFDWSFHYHTVAGLDDYQHLVPQNYGGCGYDDWDTYREYFHSYEIELEYLKYWKELLKELKWMEDYVLMKRPSITWGRICTRGCYQAIKIASRFSKITEGLARGAYYDCIEMMCLDIYWYKELDGIYFEIWQRINKLKMSFRDALDSVYKSNKFPLRHHKMKDALENDDLSEMEKEFRTCTTGITGEMTEDKARDLIADAIKNQRERPKFYAQYIKKKINIAGIIGVIPSVSP